VGPGAKKSICVLGSSALRLQCGSVLSDFSVESSAVASKPAPSSADSGSWPSSSISSSPPFSSALVFCLGICPSRQAGAIPCHVNHAAVRLPVYSQVNAKETKSPDSAH